MRPDRIERATQVIADLGASGDKEPTRLTAALSACRKGHALLQDQDRAPLILCSKQIDDLPARPGEIDPAHIKLALHLWSVFQKSFNGRAVRAEKRAAFVVVKTRLQQKQRSI